jgi:integrase
MDPAIKLICEILYHTGARVSEIRDAKWRHFNDKTHRIEYRANEVKEAKDKSIYVGPVYGRQLIDLKKNAPKDAKGTLRHEYIFLNKCRRNKLSIKGFYEFWNAACLEAGKIDPKFVKVDKRGRTVQAFSSHVCRRSRITLQIEAGVNFATIAANTGHSPDGVFSRYVQTNPARVEEMVNNIDKTDKEYLARINRNKLLEVWTTETDPEKKAILETLINKE